VVGETISKGLKAGPFGMEKKHPLREGKRGKARGRGPDREAKNVLFQGRDRRARGSRWGLCMAKMNSRAEDEV